MAEDDPLHYLPPGWTEEKYANATEADFESLPDEVLERNMQRMAAENKLISDRNMTIINDDRAARGAPPISQEQRDLHPLVKQVESSGFQDFGFILFRTDYSNEARWQRFVEEYDPLLQRGMDNASPESGIDRIRDKLFIKIVDDDVLDSSSPADVARAFRLFKEDGDVEPGLDTKMCLMVDAECISSVIDPRPDQDGKTTPPFVKAVDVNLGSGVNNTSDYPGYFKVAISSLVTEFYHALSVFGQPSELAPFADPVWEDSLGHTSEGSDWNTIQDLLNASAGSG